VVSTLEALERSPSASSEVWPGRDAMAPALAAAVAVVVGDEGE